MTTLGPNCRLVNELGRPQSVFIDARDGVLNSRSRSFGQQVLRTVAAHRRDLRLQLRCATGGAL